MYVVPIKLALHFERIYSIPPLLLCQNESIAVNQYLTYVVFAHTSKTPIRLGTYVCTDEEVCSAMYFCATKWSVEGLVELLTICKYI